MYSVALVTVSIHEARIFLSAVEVAFPFSWRFFTFAHTAVARTESAAVEDFVEWV